MPTPRHATALETVSVTVPPHALEAYEAALAEVCGTVGFFHDEEAGLWTVEGVKDQGARRSRTRRRAGAGRPGHRRAGHRAPPRRPPPRAGWHAPARPSPNNWSAGASPSAAPISAAPPTPGRLTILLDAAVAFGSGEHGSTRGCLRALERVAHRRPRRILDLGTGSGILAMAAARLLHRRVRGTDIDPWSVRTAARQCAAQPGGRPGPVRPRRWLVRAGGQPAAGRTIWCSPTSWRGRCAGWRGRSPAISRPAAPRSWPGCWSRRRAGCWPRTGARAWCWSAAAGRRQMVHAGAAPAMRRCCQP